MSFKLCGGEDMPPLSVCQKLTSAWRYWAPMRISHPRGSTVQMRGIASRWICSELSLLSQHSSAQGREVQFLATFAKGENDDAWRRSPPRKSTRSHRARENT
jgi:hypothetical protein